ncbi:DUF3748 domain-containing protein [Cyclobacterium sp. 1_MG-2023]|uniref:DUF3748 domain-containing protein n=1 Tax=Cyclobacterium sp. 1_MG-2023 TaxID=3062681 RepID=UPI0026E2B7E3|nr:DUF3748 domain-containing protein [Cyclobacterium sp. 1_MG-2023]MDO6436388.1 DUF3748 domain-containing protein [Cyclobacterium sp. 1_MG-2023]
MTLNKPKNYLFTALFIMVTSTLFSQEFWQVKQLTHQKKNHAMDNNQNFSPDDVWIVYDTRPNEGGIGENAIIEKVNVQSGKTKVVYQTTHANEYGPGVGAVSYHPSKNELVFIHGLPPSSKEKPYAMHRRLGRIVNETTNSSYWMDSRDVEAPFTAGALRGGTHRHQWSGDGDWLGYTYNDALMYDLEEKTGETYNLRTVGVSKRNLKSPSVSTKKAENFQGEWFSVLVVKVVPNPRPGSEEISKAYSDWWVGQKGYQKADGSRQMARAFLGDLKTEKGEKLTEVFIVDIPEKIDVEGPEGPLAGTSTTMPMPPAGTEVRRLTYTENAKYPGVTTDFRHWVTSAMDGAFLSYLAKDENGIDQVFLIPAIGGEPKQVSFHDTSVQSTVRWHPKAKEFAYVCNNQIFVNTVDEGMNPGKASAVTESLDTAPYAVNYSNDGKKIAFNKDVEGHVQIFVAERP